MNLSLYARVNELHGASPWGSVLDAGSGPGSKWLRDRPLAVACKRMLRHCAIVCWPSYGARAVSDTGMNYITVAEPM